MIEKNLKNIRAEIKDAADKCEKDPEECANRRKQIAMNIIMLSEAMYAATNLYFVAVTNWNFVRDTALDDMSTEYERSVTFTNEKHSAADCPETTPPEMEEYPTSDTEQQDIDHSSKKSNLYAFFDIGQFNKAGTRTYQFHCF